MARTIITASEGMILTDGAIYGTKIFLAEGRSAEEFHEIPREEYEKIIDEQEAMNDASDVRG